MDEHRIAALESRVAELERRLLSRPESAQVEQESRLDYRSAPPPVAAAPPQAGPQPPAPRQVPSPGRVPPSGFSVGTSEALLKWAGIGLVVLAVVFALGLAIDRGWITPALRVAASSAVAVVLFVAGQRIRQARLVFAETLQGAAFVVAYLTALSALVMDLVSGNVGFAAMVAVTVAALGAAAVLDSPPVGVLGVLGGFATPLLLQSGIDDPAVLALYIPLLAAAGWALFVWTGWRSLANATALATWILLGIVVVESPVASVGSAAVAVGLMTWLVPLARAIFESRESVRSRPTHFMERALAPLLEGTTARLTYSTPVVTLALAAVAFDLTRYQWSPIVAAAGVLFGLVAVALSRAGFREHAYVHTTVSAVLVSVGVTLALDGEVLLVSLGLQAVALGYIAGRLGHRAMRWQATTVTGIALLAVLGRSFDRGFDGSASAAAWLSEAAVLGLVAWKAAIEREFRSIFGAAVHLVALAWLFTVLGDPWVIVAVAALYVAARLANLFELADFELSIPPNAVVILVMAAAAALSQYVGEIDYSAGRVGALAAALAALVALVILVPHPLRAAEGAVAYLTLLAWIVVAAGSSDAWITGGWVLVGLVTLAVGVRGRHDQAQLAGWATLAVATGKLLLVDLEATDPLVRIGLFFGIGVSFLGLAYLLPTRLAPTEPDGSPSGAAATSPGELDPGRQ